uniref:Proteasome activator PA28 C-terminal domain-containing protein n=1 Tax=Acrobeloides nanus TaxID=290746 RepID=A0A914C0W9_9BILA
MNKEKVDLLEKDTKKLSEMVLMYKKLLEKAYKEAIHELDMKEFLNMRTYMCGMRDDVNILHGLIMQNIEKIEQPRDESEPAYIRTRCR